MLSIKYEKKASKFLKKLAVRADTMRILNKVEELSNKPFPKESKRVEGSYEFKVFRIRVGSYRILYFVDYNISKIYIIKIDKREMVY